MGGGGGAAATLPACGFSSTCPSRPPSARRFTRLATNVSQVYVSFFVATTLAMSKSAIALVPLVLYLSQLAATIALKRVAAALGRHYSMLAGALLFGAACAAMLLIPAADSWAVYPAVGLLGVGSAVVTVISVSMEADLVGRNVESGAFVYGAMSFTDKLSNGLVILAIQTGQTAVARDGELPRFYRVVNALVPLVAIGLACAAAFTISFPAHLQGSQSFRNLRSYLRGTGGDSDAPPADDASPRSAAAASPRARPVPSANGGGGSRSRSPPLDRGGAAGAGRLRVAGGGSGGAGAARRTPDPAAAPDTLSEPLLQEYPEHEPLLLPGLAAGTAQAPSSAAASLHAPATAVHAAHFRVMPSPPSVPTAAASSFVSGRPGADWGASTRGDDVSLFVQRADSRDACPVAS